LRASGWWPGRHIELTSEVAVLEDEGIEPWPEFLAFLEQYAGLEIKSDDGTQMLWIDGARAARETDPEWTRAYSDRIGSVLAPVGGHSHMTIYLGRDGEFYGGFDREYGRLASSMEELLNALFNRGGPPARLEYELE
jgi:hypothetical protein